MSSVLPTLSQSTDRSFFRWVRRALPQSLVEFGVSEGRLNSFSALLLKQGWRGWLFEPKASILSHLADEWKHYQHVSCALQSSGPIGTTLSDAGVPPCFGIFVLNYSDNRLRLVTELVTAGFRPSLFALRDEDDSSDQRFPAYEFLSTNGYRFAGVEQVYSLWSLAEIPAVEVAEGEPIGEVSELPGVLVSDALARICFDTPTTEQNFAAVGHLDLAVGGWAFLDIAEAVPTSVYVEAVDLLNGRTSYVRALRYPRLDVSRHFNRPELLLCGFQASVSMRQYHAHGMRLRVIQCVDGKCYASTVHLTIERGLKEYEATARQGLAQKYLRGSGVEIGALQRKLELPATCKVRYIDRMAMADLLHHYPELKGMRLQSPDVVDNGERLGKLAANSQDFVIANHFFEHSENPIQTLENLLRVLKPRGILFMAVPDKRYTFDQDRPSTRFERLKETYYSGKRSDRLELYTEWVQLVERHGEKDVGERVKVLVDSDYSIHFNVWTADELFSFLLRLRTEFSLAFNIAAAVCSDNESIMLLEKVLESK